MTMLRFEPEKRVGFHEYMRSDGTRSYFFSLETVRDLFHEAGFIEVMKHHRTMDLRSIIYSHFVTLWELLQENGLLNVPIVFIF